MKKLLAVACSSVGLGLAVLLGTPGQAQQAKQAQITYYKDVAPILAKNCVSCHVAGGIAPFSLTDPKNAVAYSARIVQVTQSGYMPPWLPGADSEPYLNERKLSSTDKKVLADWARAGAPLGTPTKK